VWRIPSANVFPKGPLIDHFVLPFLFALKSTLKYKVNTEK
jgi:hypothetical protein